MSVGSQVLVVGYGVIGKRVADAVHLQQDMHLLGVVDLNPSSLVRIANERSFPVFATSPEALEKMKKGGLHVEGELSDVLNQADIVVDASPGGVASSNASLYGKYGKPFILNGGEKHEATGLSFNSFANYREALGAGKARVVSCNTTSICRILTALRPAGPLREVFVAIVRRAADPVHTSVGPINAIEPTLGVSHHALDVTTVIPDVKIDSFAVKVPTTLAHVHMMRLTYEEPVEKHQVLELLQSTPRIVLVAGRSGITTTAHVLELFRDRLRPRGDMWEVAVWEDSLHIDGNVVTLSYCVHMESIVIPENIDAIRALLRLQENPSASIEMTDRSLGCFQDNSDYTFLDSSPTATRVPT